MQRRSLLAGPGSAMILLALAPRAKAGETPTEIVERLYSLSAGTKGKWDSVFLKAAVRNRTFSKALLRAWNAADARNRRGDEGWLDFDIMSNSQDPAVNDSHVAIASENAARITISATFGASPDPKGSATRVLYDFVPEDGSWKPDDIRSESGDDRWSIRKLARDAVAAKR